jgi:hypothetical protein
LIALNLSQLRIEREEELKSRAEDYRLRSKQERRLQQELIRLSQEDV